MSTVVVSKEDLLVALERAIAEHRRCQEMVWVDEERLRQTRDKEQAAYAAVSAARDEIMIACSPKRESETMGDLFKRHGLRP